jgi:cytoskeletal protein CcmA (bactofilin family)
MTNLPTQREPRDASECLPEWVYSVYVDRELEGEPLREAETHLVRCRDCRELVMALEDEAGVMRNALHVGEVAEAPIQQAAPARGLVVGVGPAIVAAFVCLSALGWIIETQIPSPMEWLNPMELTGAFEMFFDTVFMLKDQAPAIYQLALSSAALFSVAFLLTSTLTALTRRFTKTNVMAPLLLGALLSAGMFQAPTATAIELRFGNEQEIIPAGEVVEATWVISAEEVTIAGTLRGDLFVLAERVIISGELDGDLLGAARKVEISGRVRGSIRAFGERVRVSGEIDRNAYMGAEETLITESGRVGRDVIAAGDGVVLSGKTGRDAMTFSSWIEVRGEIAGDLEAHAERIDIMDGAHIGGDLRAKFFEKEENLEVSSGAVIAGATTSESHDLEHPRYMDRYRSSHFYIFTLLTFTAAFLTGMVLFRFAPWVFGSHLSTGSEFFRALAFGFVALIAAPLFLIILALTVVGIPMALIGLALFGMGAYFAKIIVGGTIGMAIFGEPEESDWSGFGMPLAAGLAIVVVSVAIPYLGGVVGFVTLLAGLGMLADQMRLRFWV